MWKTRVEMMCFLLICFKDYNTNFIYEKSSSGSSPLGKLVFMVADVTKSLASMRITIFVQSSGQRSSSALMIFISSVVAENS